jgi:hypothetical protein
MRQDMQRGIVQTVARRPLVSRIILPRTSSLSTQIVQGDARAKGEAGRFLGELIWNTVEPYFR